MRTDAIFKFNNAFEVWHLTTRENPVTGALIGEYQFDRDAKGLVLPGGRSSTPALVSREVFYVGDQLRSITDTRGNELFTASGQSISMYVTNAMPVLDVFGAVVGQTYTISSSMPRDFDSILESLVSN